MADIKKTIGQQIVEHDARGIEIEDHVIEYRKCMERDLVKRMFETIEKSRHEDIYKDKDFYLVVTILNDPILKKTRHIIFARQSCPTPVYKQAVWKYRHAGGELQFLWSIPDSIRYHHILNNQHRYLVDKHYREIAKFVIMMERGDLLDFAKKENGEKPDGIIKIINQEESCSTIM